MKPLGTLFVWAGLSLIVIGLIWASVVGYYPSEVPGLLATLGGGALMVFIGSRMVASTKPTHVEWKPTAPAVSPVISPAMAPAATPAPDVAVVAHVPDSALPTAQAATETAHIIDKTIAVPRRPRRVQWGFRLPDGSMGIVRDQALVGRAPQISDEHPNADLIVIDDSSVSKSHASLKIVGGALYVLDLDSANGTVVIVDTIESSCIAGEWMLVPDGATLGLGTVDLECSSASTREVAS